MYCDGGQFILVDPVYANPKVEWTVIRWSQLAKLRISVCWDHPAQISKEVSQSTTAPAQHREKPTNILYLVDAV